MKIRILGTRGEILETLPRHSKHSGILVDDELLIDVGEKDFLKLNPRWILISHFHPDHAYFVRRGHVEKAPDIPIFAPEQPDPAIILCDRESKIGPYTVTPIPTHHSKNVKSQAYVIRKGKSSFLYTADIVWIDKEYHPSIGPVDLIITEASFIRKGGLIRKDAATGRLIGHNGVPNLIHLLKPFAKTFLFMHFGTWFYKDVVEAKKKLGALGKENSIHVIVGHDGLVIDLANL